MTSPAPASPTTRRGRVLALRSQLPLVSEDSERVWVHVAWEGSWEGHHQGAFSLDRSDFEQIVANFEANPNAIPLDTEHATVWAQAAPAVGWVHALEIRDAADGTAHLYAFVELTDQAREWIASGAYRYSSGVFEFDSIDPESGDEVGTVMSSLALTNVPFLRGQSPIQLSADTSLRAATASARGGAWLPLYEAGRVHRAGRFVCTANHH